MLIHRRGGLTAVAYLIAWVIVPPQPLPVHETKPAEPARQGTA